MVRLRFILPAFLLLGLVVQPVSAGGLLCSNNWIKRFFPRLYYKVLKCPRSDDPNPTPAPTPVCPDGEELCGDVCVNTDVDTSNCGGCDIECPTSANGATTCEGGTCVLNCNEGFARDVLGVSCEDINECLLSPNGGCSQVCTNTIGSFGCECIGGYNLNADDVSCDEIDECQGIANDCTQICANRQGSYECFCWFGFRLQADGATCLPINECIEDIDNCDHECTDLIPDQSGSPGIYSCSCNSGWSLGLDGFSCININECGNVNQSLADECDHDCLDTLGSYDCSCDDGFELQANGKSCENINECTDKIANCDHQCTDLTPDLSGDPRKYFCSCNVSGWSLDLDGFSCININECGNVNQSLADECDHSCLDTEGSYDCSCDDGFELQANGKSCENINECTDKIANCDHQCTDLIPAQPGDPKFSCSCNVSGWTLDINGTSCININECGNIDPSLADNCDHYCTDTEGSFVCGCDADYTLNANGFSCDAIDLCTQQCYPSSVYPNLSSATCVYEAPNEFRCSCTVYFQPGASDEDPCVPVDVCGTIPPLDSCTDPNSYCAFDTNAENFHTCECNVGFELNETSGFCVDIDECKTGAHTCNATIKEFCGNVDGSYTCDIDQCAGLLALGTNPCGVGFVCNNTIDSDYIYNSEGELLFQPYVCIDEDECATGTHNCSNLDVDLGVDCNKEPIFAYASCTNTDGSFECSCASGFFLNESLGECEDIVDCPASCPGPNNTCIEYPGGYRCSCDDGYSLNATTNTCYSDPCNTPENQCNLFGFGYCYDDNSGTFACNCTEPGVEIFTLNRTFPIYDDPCDGLPTGTFTVPDVMSCGTNECEDALACDPGYLCVDIPVGYTCVPPPGKAPADQDLCNPNPCSAGYVCDGDSIPGGGYSCTLL